MDGDGDDEPHARARIPDEHGKEGANASAEVVAEAHSTSSPPHSAMWQEGMAPRIRVEWLDVSPTPPLPVGRGSVD
jgi:hypothetical protein